MDSFSLTVGIAGLTGLAATTIKYVKNYISAAKNGQESIANLITELEASQTNLTNLEQFLRSASAKGLSFQPTSVFRSWTRLSLDELESIIFDVLKNLHRTTIIIDALDECDKSRHKRIFLLLLQRLKQIPNLRLFVTSRQNFQDITENFNVFPQISISAHDFDLKCYMEKEMELAGIEDIVDDLFANQMIETVITKAQGMFLLAILHFRTALKEPTAGAMEDALSLLSLSLDSAFEVTISRIQRLPESRK